MLIAIEALEGGINLTCAGQRPPYGKLNVKVQSIKDWILVFFSRTICPSWMVPCIVIDVHFCKVLLFKGKSVIVAFDVPVCTASIHPSYSLKLLPHIGIKRNSGVMRRMWRKWKGQQSPGIEPRTPTWVVQPVLYHWAMTTRQPPVLYFRLITSEFLFFSTWGMQEL